MKKIVFITSVFSFLLISCSQKEILNVNKKEIILSAIKGDKSRIDTLIIKNLRASKVVINIKVEGENATFFKLLYNVPDFIKPKESLRIPIQFLPKEDFIGVVNAKILINSKDSNALSVTLGGLISKGLEGKNEPPLSWILKAHGFKIDIGWSSLANNVRPNLQGEELPQTLFVKASEKPVEIIPIARYSPAFLLPFGYYTVKKDSIELHEVGVLSDSKKYPAHQTLYPLISNGKTQFNPKEQAFGIYTVSPSHTAYSEDKWNKKYHKKNAAHACRIYPLKNAEGKIIPNQFLVCFEEAFNGDYQDYVFILKNVVLSKH